MANFILLVLVLAHCVLSTQSSLMNTNSSDVYNMVQHGAVGDGTNSSEVYNVVQHGAVGDGLVDDTQAFRDAWEATCNSSGSSPTMLIPHGKTFLLQPLTFNGDCQSRNITVLIDGSITAPGNLSAWKCLENKCHQWIAFRHFDGLHIHGSGTINGQGTKWWERSCTDNERVCGKKPTGLVIENSQRVYINGLTFKDSPQMHIAFESSEWVYATNLTIEAPSHSPNTDGIHIQNSTHVFIDHTHIGTGDDCISIGAGSSHIKITRIACGPGHGISIGSLGNKGKLETVEFVHVKNVFFTGTTNGVRIKTWQGGRGYVKNIIFERITSDGSNRPIIIDQFYCEHGHSCKNQSSAVRVSNVLYNQIHGTSDKDIAVNFACSESVPCTDIFMKNITLQYTKQGSETSSSCLNVGGLKEDQIIPNVPCLQNGENLRARYELGI